MPRYILTGAPGAGKTTLIRALERKGHCVVEEAATDVIALEQAMGIAEPWHVPSFIEQITELQIVRARAADGQSRLQLHDRSIFCTCALAKFLGYDIPATLARAVERALADATFAPSVLFVRLLGFIVRTEARRIGLEDAQRFERLHEAVYRQFGFAIIDIPPADLAARVVLVDAAIA